MLFREKILNKIPVCGTHISTGDFIVADILAQCGFDFIWIDTEHSCMDYRDLLACISVIRARGIPVVVRAQVNTPAHTKRLLEMGIDGIVFPYIETVEQAKQAIASCLYPPQGFRGFGPLGAVNYGLRDNAEYIEKSSDELAIFLQVESETAVKNLPQICQLEHADGFILGPCDMSGSIGLLGQVQSEQNMALIRSTMDILAQYDKCPGISLGTTEENEQRFWIDLGLRFVSAGTDYDYLCQNAKKNAQQLQCLMKGE
ncbi:MAG: aldolase [Clostridia bacterium]|nr:aldolase [Clostridia bacterium]